MIQKVCCSASWNALSQVIMNGTRIFLTSWLVVLILSLGTSAIASTVSGVAHEINCSDRHGQTHNHDVDHKHSIDSSNKIVASETTHDHETCMVHACSAMFTEIAVFQADPRLTVSKLLHSDPPVRVIERVESLHRPPNT